MATNVVEEEEEEVVVVVVVVVQELVEGRQGVHVVLSHRGNPGSRHLLRFEQDLGVHVDGCFGVVDVDPRCVVLVSNPQT